MLCRLIIPGNNNPIGIFINWKSGTLTQGTAIDAQQKVALLKPISGLSLESSFLATRQMDSLSEFFFFRL